MNILDKASRLVDEGGICDNCLGRRFGLLSYGLSNHERGRALRVAVYLGRDEDFESVDSVDCWVCQGVFDEVDRWVDRCVERVDGFEFSDFHVGTRVPPLIEENESLLDEVDGGEHSEAFKSEVNREVGIGVSLELGKEVDLENPDVVLVLDIDGECVEVQINPVYVFGRYRKLERGVPQTDWPCRECGGDGVIDGGGCGHCGGTGYLYRDSVESFISPVLMDDLDGSDAVFHGAGREDVDALMLGNGRPFVVEVKEPMRRGIDLLSVEEKINDEAGGVVEVEGLRYVEGGIVERVKGLDATKKYRAVIDEGIGDVTQEEVDEVLKELVGLIEQRTPRRVSHRRSDRVRERRVLDAEGWIQGGSLVLELHCEGGLYVKELVSGDRGRTNPCLSGLLGVDLEVSELDVVDVIGEFLEDE